MTINYPNVAEMLETAVFAARLGDREFLDALDELPSAIYITDKDGTITHYNKACIAFAGRTPVIQHDKWCVTWKLYSLAGEALPHDQCPMAVAIHEKREIRGVEAIAERPDGSRIQFMPYPTPLFDDDGDVIGAVNLLVDIGQRKHARYLIEQSARCRRLANSVLDQRASGALQAMALEFDEQAARLNQPN